MTTLAHGNRAKDYTSRELSDDSHDKPGKERRPRSDRYLERVVAELQRNIKQEAANNKATMDALKKLQDRHLEDRQKIRDLEHTLEKSNLEHTMERKLLAQKMDTYEQKMEAYEQKLETIKKDNEILVLNQEKRNDTTSAELSNLSRSMAELNFKVSKGSIPVAEIAEFEENAVECQSEPRVGHQRCSSLNASQNQSYMSNAKYHNDSTSRDRKKWARGQNTYDSTGKQTEGRQIGSFLGKSATVRYAY